VIQRRDIVAVVGVARVGIERVRGTRRGPILGLPGGEAAAEIVMAELEPGEER
jgi:hypothetical protein